jgi:hypothetical protein
MAMKTYPLALPDDLYDEVQSAAASAGVAMADAMRQTMKIGLPKFREQHAAAPGLKPFTAAEARAAFAPDPEWDRLEKLSARRSHRQPEAD